MALALVGLCSLAVALLPRAWIAKLCNKDRDDERLFSPLLKLARGFAAVFYLVALVAYFAPHSWDLNPQLMFALCLWYFVKMTIDPLPISIFLISIFLFLAPMNAGIYGALGVTLGYAGLIFRRRRA